MAKSIEQLFIELGLDTKDFKAGLNAAVGDVKKNTGKMKSQWKLLNAEVNKMNQGINRAFGGMKAKLGIAGLGVGIAALGKSMVSAKMEMENYETEFEVLLGSMDAAKERLAELTKFAATTPFELPQVIQAGKKLQNFGLYTQENLRMVGDAASASGQPIEELSLWFGRLYDGIMSGRPVGEATNRLQELALISGPTRQKIEEMQKAGKDGAEIWSMFSGEMSQFSGMMVKKSETMSGMISNLQDAWFQFRVQVGEKVFGVLKNDINAILTKINEWASDGRLEQWATELGQNIKNLYESVRSIFDFLKSNWTLITSMAVGLGTYVVATKAATVATKGWEIAQKILNGTMKANPVGIVVTTIAILATAIDYVVKKTIGWGAVWDYVKRSANSFLEYFKAFVGSVKDYVSGMGKMFGGLGKIISGAFKLDLGQVKEGFNELKSGPQDFANSAKMRFQDAGTNAVAIWNQTKEQIENQPIEPKVDGPVLAGAIPTTGGATPGGKSSPAKPDTKTLELVTKNTQEEYNLRRNSLEMWMDESVRSAGENQEFILQVKKEYAEKATALNTEEFEFKRQQVTLTAQAEIADAQGNANRIEAIRSGLNTKLQAIDLGERQARLDTLDLLRQAEEDAAKGTENEYARRIAALNLWKDESVNAAGDNKERLLQIEKDYANKLLQIEKEQFDKRRALAKQAAAAEIANATGNADLIAALRENLADKLSAIDLEERDHKLNILEQIEAAQENADQERLQRQQAVASYLKGSLQPITTELTNALTTMNANWNQAWNSMKSYFINTFFNSMTSKITELVAAQVVGEQTKRKEMMLTAATAVKTSAKEVFTSLKSASASIYSALAKMATKLSFLGPLAIPAIAAAGAGIFALFGKFRKKLGLAVGTRVTQPTEALIGEAGPEIVAPEKDFMTYSRELLQVFSEKLNNIFSLQSSATAATSGGSSVFRSENSSVISTVYEKLQLVSDTIKIMLEKISSFFTVSSFEKIVSQKSTTATGSSVTEKSEIISVFERIAVIHETISRILEKVQQVITNTFSQIVSLSSVSSNRVSDREKIETKSSGVFAKTIAMQDIGYAFDVIVEKIVNGIDGALDFIQEPAIAAMDRIELAGTGYRVTDNIQETDDSEYKEQALAILKAIRDKDQRIEFTNQIKGDDLYQLVQRFEKKYGRLS